MRAKWDSRAEDMLRTMDGWLENLPSMIDAQYFENHEQGLVEYVRKRAETLAERMRELERVSVTVVDAG